MPPRKLHFAEGLKLPTDAVTQTFAFIGRKGAGKTYGAGVLVEQLLTAGAQTVVIDTVGNWYGLRLGAGGKGKGFDLPVLGGEHGDIPLEPTGGALVADLLVDHQVSAVIDITNMRKGARQTFMIAFAEQLFERKKRQRSPMHLVVEEAQKLIPQQSQGKGGQIHRLKGAMEDLVRIGRNYGIGCSMLTQRPQSVDKEVLNQVEALVCFQTTGPHERKAIKGWVVEQGIDLDLINKLPGLPVGTCFFWSPQWLNVLGQFKVRTKTTYDASSTPVLGQSRRKPKPLAKVDLSALRGSMLESIAKHEQNDPTALKRKVRELQAQVSKLEQRKPETVEVPVVDSKQLDEIRSLHNSLSADLDHLKSVSALLSEAAKALSSSCTQTPRYKPPRDPGACDKPTMEVLNDSDRRRFTSKPGDEVRLVGKQRNMLAALCSVESGSLTRKQLAVQVGMSPGSGGFNNYIGSLARQNLVTTGNGEVTITVTGQHCAEGAEVATTPQEILDLWLPKLTGKQRDILQLLFDNAEYGYTRKNMAVAVGMAPGSGGFNNYVGRLSSLDLIVTGGGQLSLNKDVFRL